MSVLGSELAGATLALCAAVLLAVQALCIRFGTVEGKTVEALAVVLVVNLVLYVPAAAIAYGPTVQLSPLAIGAFALAGLVGAVVGRGAYYGAITSLGASRTEPIKASQPLHASVIAVVVLGERLTALSLLGILCIVAGVAVITARTTTDARTRGRGTRLGLALAFGAALAYGIEPTLASVGLEAGTPLLVGLAVKMVVAASVVLAYLAWHGSVLSGFTASSRRWYLAAGLANTLFQAAYYGALAVGQVVVVVPVIQTSPLFVAVLSVLVAPQREHVTVTVVAAASVVVGGAILVTVAG